MGPLPFFPPPCPAGKSEASVNIFEAAHALFVAHFGDPFFRPPRPVDLRGFRMTRSEAARWLDAIDRPTPDDSHPTRGDIARVAAREDLLLWSWTNRGPDPRSRAIAAIYLAAWRGPDFDADPPP